MTNCASVERKVILSLSILLLISITYSVYITFKVCPSCSEVTYPHPIMTDCPICPTCKPATTMTTTTKHISTLDTLEAIDLQFRGCDCCQCKHSATRFNACLTDALDLEDGDDVAFLLFFEVLRLFKLIYGDMVMLMLLFLLFYFRATSTNVTRRVSANIF